MEGKIRAILIFEMLGRPVEHLKSTLEEFVGKVSREEGIEILNSNLHEPKRVEDMQQEIYTTFAETEIQFKDINSLLRIIFVYMPSHIEIISPSEFQVKNFEIGTLMSEITRKLHQYDEIAKRLAIERNILMKQLQDIGVRPAILQLQAQQPRQQPKKQSKKQLKTQAKKEKKISKRKKR